MNDTIVAIAGRKDGDDQEVTADTEFLRGVQSVAPEQSLSGRLETFKFRNEPNPKRYFQAGTVIEIGGASREARRFAMVHAVDGLVGIGGTKRTSQQLTFAFATEVPALPVPCFGGQARAIWDDHETALVERLGLKRAAVKQWKTTPSTPAAATKLAREMVQTFIGSLQQRCFVIMPFSDDFSALIDFVIDPVVRGMGDEPIHLGRREQPGDVGRQISDGISRADYVICVLDGMRPNVLYELGIAHALGKPSVLLWKKGADPGLSAPFDIVQEQRIEYAAVDTSLKPRLKRALRYARTQRAV